VVYFGLSWIAPDFMRPLRSTDLGREMLAIAGVCIISGYVFMMKIAKVDY
jgi:hypothetical protein